jgi:hypothetical protein
MLPDPSNVIDESSTGSAPNGVSALRRRQSAGGIRTSSNGIPPIASARRAG